MSEWSGEPDNEDPPHSEGEGVVWFIVILTVVLGGLYFLVSQLAQWGVI